MHDFNVDLPPPPSGRGGEAGGEADGGAAGGVAAGVRPLLPHAALLEDGPRDAGQLEAPPARGGAVEPRGVRPHLQVTTMIEFHFMSFLFIPLMIMDDSRKWKFTIKTPLFCTFHDRKGARRKVLFLSIACPLLKT